MFSGTYYATQASFNTDIQIVQWNMMKTPQKQQPGLGKSEMKGLINQDPLTNSFELRWLVACV